MILIHMQVSHGCNLSDIQEQINCHVLVKLDVSG